MRRRWGAAAVRRLPRRLPRRLRGAAGRAARPLAVRRVQRRRRRAGHPGHPGHPGVRGRRALTAGTGWRPDRSVVSQALGFIEKRSSERMKVLAVLFFFG